MDKFLRICSCLAILAPVQAQADFVGFQLGLDSWKAEYSGTLTSDGDSIDLAEDLGFTNETHSIIWAKIEHPVPALPNFKIVSADFKALANTTLEKDISFNGEYSISTPVRTQIDLGNTELTLYYELLDNWINLDAGLTVRNYDGQATISSAAKTERVDLDFAVPSVYLDARIDLPFTGFFVDSTLNSIKYSDNAISDISVAIGYESAFGLGARLGYRTQGFEFSESDLSSDLDFSGTYLNVFYHF